MFEFTLEQLKINKNHSLSKEKCLEKKKEKKKAQQSW
jgi:hypothetical protein